MKKISMIAIIGTVMSGAAFAEFSEGAKTVVPVQDSRGGFVNGVEKIVTVEMVNEMRDDVPVVVRGNITQRKGDEKYVFTDGTGSITVEIDDEDWRGQTIEPTDTVKLYGEVDRGWFSTEIGVDYVEKM